MAINALPSNALPPGPRATSGLHAPSSTTAPPPPPSAPQPGIPPGMPPRAAVPVQPPPFSSPPPPVSPASTAQVKSFTLSQGITRDAHRIGIYGPACVGKTSLAAMLPNAVVVDLERGSLDLPIQRLECDGATWSDLRALVQGPLLDQFSTIIIDSFTQAEKLAVAHVLATIQNEKGKSVANIEGFGWGKGYSYSYETFLLLMADLDRHFRAGRNVVCIMHDVTQKKPNPEGEDYLRFEPHLQNQGTGNTRSAVIEWLDHLLFIDFDKNVDRDGKASGGGTRTIYPEPQPHFVAKSRRLHDSMQYIQGDPSVWNRLFSNQ